ncbi:28849_t:CDS:2, partial [Gigaspora margarita]
KNKILSEKTINRPTKYSEHKKNFENKALQQLYQLHSDLIGQSVWFFPTFKKSAKGCILYKKSENCNGISIDQIIKEKNHVSYFKNSEIIILISIKDALVKIICNNAEFANITLVESEEFLQLIFSNKKNIQKELHIKQALHRC